ITGGELVDARGETATVFHTGEPMSVRLHYQARQPMPRPHFAVDIHRTDGVYCAGINTQMDGIAGGTIEGAGTVELALKTLPLLPGCYTVSLGILDGSMMAPIDARLKAYPFSVASSKRDFGLIAIEREWRSERPALRTPVLRAVR